MATFKATANAYTTEEWAKTGSILEKNTEEPTAPSEATLIKVGATGKKQVIIWTGLPKTFKKITALTVHVYAKKASEAKGVAINVLNAAKENKLKYEPTIKTTSAWYKESLSKANAEALSKSDVENLAVELECLLNSTMTVYEVYLSGEYEEEVGKLEGTTKIKFSQSGAVAGRGAIAGHSGVILSGTTSINGTAAVAGSSKTVLGSSAKIAASAKIAGIVQVKLSEVAHIAAHGVVSSKTPIKLSAAGPIAAHGAIASKTPIKLAVTGSIEGIAGLVGILEGTTKTTVDAKGVIDGIAVLGGSSHLVTRSTGKLTPSGGLAGAANILFADTANIIAEGSITGLSEITFGQSADIAAQVALSGSTSAAVITTFGTLHSVGIVRKLSGSTSIRFGANATATIYIRRKMFGTEKQRLPAERENQIYEELLEEDVQVVLVPGILTVDDEKDSVTFEIATPPKKKIVRVEKVLVTAPKRKPHEMYGTPQQRALAERESEVYEKLLDGNIQVVLGHDT